MDYPTLPVGFHWAPLGGSWYTITLFVVYTPCSPPRLDWAVSAEDEAQACGPCHYEACSGWGGPWAVDFVGELG